MDNPSGQDVVLEAVARLAQQTRSDIGPVMSIWDIAAGLTACIWKQGGYDAADAVLRLNHLWDVVPPADRKQGSRPEGVNIIGEGVGLWAGFALADVTYEAEQVLTQALRLVPGARFGVRACHAILDGIY